MSAPKYESPRELLELASLDALGLLDREEREAFEEAFRDAPPALRAQIRREQGRIADARDTLPDVEPPSGLRDRVLMAVHSAIASVRGEDDVAGRIGHGAWSLRANVSPLWRAACVGFAAATIVLLVSGAYLQRSYSQTVSVFRDGKLAEQIAQQLGSEFVDLLYDPQTMHHALAPVSDFEGASSARALVMVNVEFERGVLSVHNLPVVDGEYRLELVDNTGTRRTLAQFTSDGGMRAIDFAMTTFSPGMEIDVVQVAHGGGAASPVLSKAFPESM